MSHSLDELDTYSIPDGVDPEIALERNELIERWQDGEVEAEVALQGIAKLYWQNQHAASDATRFYLVDTKANFAIEAGLDSDTAFDIWEKENEE